MMREYVEEGGFGWGGVGESGGEVGGVEGENSLILSLYCGDTFSRVEQARHKNEAI